MSQTRYVPMAQPDGWLSVRLDGLNNQLGAEISLPYFLKLTLLEAKDGREYFTILEGYSYLIGSRLNERAVGTLFVK